MDDDDIQIMEPDSGAGAGAGSKSNNSSSSSSSAFSAMMYTPANMPPEPPRKPDGSSAATYEFYGCYPEDHTVELDMDYREYVAERRRHCEAHPDQWDVKPVDGELPPQPAGVAARCGRVHFVRYWAVEGYDDGGGLSAA